MECYICCRERPLDSILTQDLLKKYYNYRKISKINNKNKENPKESMTSHTQKITLRIYVL